MSGNAAGLLCIGCGYDLRALTSDRCPECGLDISVSKAAAAQTWRRKDLGSWRSFWATVNTAMFKPEMLAKLNAPAVDAKLEARASRRYRWLVWLAMTASAVTGFLIYVSRIGGLSNFDMPFAHHVEFYLLPPASSGWAWQWIMTWSAGATIWPVIPVGIALAIWLGLLGPRLILRWAGVNQGRRAMADYLAVGLLWIGPALIMVCGTYATVDRFGGWIWEGLCASLCFLLALTVPVCLFIWWICTMRLMHRTRQSWAWTLGMGIFYPVMWAVVAIVCLTTVPMLVGFVWLMIDSLR